MDIDIDIIYIYVFIYIYICIYIYIYIYQHILYENKNIKIYMHKRWEYFLHRGIPFGYDLSILEQSFRALSISQLTKLMN